jgi:hypothetical protein
LTALLRLIRNREACKVGFAAGFFRDQSRRQARLVLVQLGAVIGKYVLDGGKATCSDKPQPPVIISEARTIEQFELRWRLNEK